MCLNRVSGVSRVSRVSIPFMSGHVFKYEASPEQVAQGVFEPFQSPLCRVMCLNTYGYKNENTKANISFNPLYVGSCV